MQAVIDLVNAAYRMKGGKGDAGAYVIRPKFHDMELRFDIKTVSEANTREHWALKHRRKKAQQADFAMLWRYHKAKVTLPAVITFTRYSCNLLDADNLAGAFKHVQDQLARELGIDDGSSLVQWRYQQERISKREHYFTVKVG